MQCLHVRGVLRYHALQINIYLPTSFQILAHRSYPSKSLNPLDQIQTCSTNNLHIKPWLTNLWAALEQCKSMFMLWRGSLMQPRQHVAEVPDRIMWVKFNGSRSPAGPTASKCINEASYNRSTTCHRKLIKSIPVCIQTPVNTTLAAITQREHDASPWRQQN